MPNKRLERLYVEHLREVLSDFPEGEIVSGESPDFTVDSIPRLGIEVTVFHLPPDGQERPHQEIQSRKNKVVATAWGQHRQAGGPPLNVRVFFNDPAALTKSNIPSIADALAKAVLAEDVPRRFSDPTLILSWDALPPTIGHVSIYAAIEQPLWAPDAGGWVAPIQAEHVQGEIDRKRAMVTPARRKCDALWLVIVNDVFSNAAQAEIGDETLAHTYEHPFDRVIWFVPHGGGAAHVLRGRTSDSGSGTSRERDAG